MKSLYRKYYNDTLYYTFMSLKPSYDVTMINTCDSDVSLLRYTSGIPQCWKMKFTSTECLNTKMTQFCGGISLYKRRFKEILKFKFELLDFVVLLLFFKRLKNFYFHFITTLWHGFFKQCRTFFTVIQAYFKSNF